MAADWHELMIPQRTMRPSIARVNWTRGLQHIGMGTLKMRDWNLRHKRAQKCRGGKCETGKNSTRNAGVKIPQTGK